MAHRVKRRKTAKDYEETEALHEVSALAQRWAEQIRLRLQELHRDSPTINE